MASSKESACNAGDPGLIPGSEDPLKKGVSTHSNILAWRIPWTEEPGGLHPRGHKEWDTAEWLILLHSMWLLLRWLPHLREQPPSLFFCACPHHTSGSSCSPSMCLWVSYLPAFLIGSWGIYLVLCPAQSPWPGMRLGTDTYWLNKWMNGWTFLKGSLAFGALGVSPAVSPSLPLPLHKDKPSRKICSYSHTWKLTPRPHSTHRNTALHPPALTALKADTFSWVIRTQPFKGSPSSPTLRG